MAHVYRQLLIVLAMVWTMALALQVSAEELGPRDYYTAQTIWYQHPHKVYVLNYQLGERIPPGTLVRNVAFEDGRRPQMTFNLNGTAFTIYMNKGWHPDIEITTVVDRYFTKKPLQEQASDMSQRELLYAVRGESFIGMSKRAVLMAYGYPPEHVTASTSENRWYYWQSRMGKKYLEFDDDGFVINIRD